MRKLIRCLNRTPGKRSSGSLFVFEQTLSSMQGFTLTELITVIAILGILLAISTPKMLSTISTYQVNAAIRKAYSDIQSAKLHAIQNNTLWAFEAEGASSYCIKKQAAPPNWSDGCTATGDQVTTVVDIANDYRSLVPTYTPAATPFRIIFKPDGTCSGSAGGTYYVKFCKAGIGRQILITQLTGYMKIDNNPVACP
jgi:prepilin-type N-terminal cleavage/methylation domain-containing protein